MHTVPGHNYAGTLFSYPCKEGWSQWHALAIPNIQDAEAARMPQM